MTGNREKQKREKRKAMMLGEIRRVEYEEENGGREDEERGHRIESERRRHGRKR